MLGRHVFVTEPAGLLLAELEDALRPGVERQRPAPDPGPLAEDPGQLVAKCGQVDASRRSVSAGTPSSGSTRAWSRCSASRTGDSMDWAAPWAAAMASWAFSYSDRVASEVLR